VNSNAPYEGQQPDGPAPDFGNPAADPNQKVSSFGANPDKQQIGTMLDDAAKKYGIPPDILKGIAWQESKWNPKAVGDGGQSHGMMQIYKTAHPDYDIARGQRDPSYNIEYGAKFLSGLHKKTGNWNTAVARYNGAGPAAQRYSQSVMNYAQTKPWQK